MNPIRLSVFTTCYNQESYISEAIDSVMNQSILPFEYIICDDCSSDNTWNIIQSFQKKYPDIIKSYRNEVNIGLYPNANFAQSLVTGNIITAVSGDDLILPGSFEDIINTIQSNELDPEEDSFMIIYDIVNLFENGSKTYNSNYKYRNKRMFSLRLRYILDERFGFVSKKSFIATGSINTELGLHSDFLWGFDRIINTEKFVFINKFYHVYRVGVGVASKTSSIESAKSYLSVLELIHTKYCDSFNNRDELFYKYICQKQRFIIQKSFKNYFDLFILLILNFFNFYNSKKLIKAISFMFFSSNFKRKLLKYNFYKVISK